MLAHYRLLGAMLLALFFLGGHPALGQNRFSGQKAWVVVKTDMHDFSFSSNQNIADFDKETEARTYAYQLNKDTPPSDISNYIYLVHRRGTWGTGNNPTAQSRSPDISFPTPDQRAADLNNRLKLLQSDTKHTFQEVLKEKGQDVESAVKRVEKLSNYLNSTVPTLTNDAFKDVNGLITQYNAIAKEQGASGPGGLQPMEPLDAQEMANLTPQLQKEAGQERVLTIKAKLEEAELQSSEKKLNDAKEELEVVGQQIAADKADGIDVSDREQHLAQALETYDGMKSQYQQQVDTYEQDRNQLETTRTQIREQKQVVEEKRPQATVPETKKTVSNPIVGTWSDGKGSSWRFGSDGTWQLSPGRNRGQWKMAGDGIAIKYSGATAWLNLKLVGNTLVDQAGFIGHVRLEKANE